PVGRAAEPPAEPLAAPLGPPAPWPPSRRHDRRVRPRRGARDRGRRRTPAPACVELALGPGARCGCEARRALLAQRLAVPSGRFRGARRRRGPGGERGAAAAPRAAPPHGLVESKIRRRGVTTESLEFSAEYDISKYSEQNSMYAMIGVFTIVMFAVLWAIPWFTYLKDEEEIEERRGAGGRRGRGARSLRHQRWPWPVRRRIRAGEGEGRRQGEVRPPFSATCSVFKAPRDLAVQGEGGGRAWTMYHPSAGGARGRSSDRGPQALTVGGRHPQRLCTETPGLGIWTWPGSVCEQA
ncbi:unnamed protein product, partial [Prorocentrum cordatum]